MVTTAEHVTTVLTLLAPAAPIVGGGWGVDALAGSQTREHADLDVAIDATFLDIATKALMGAGYAITADWLPVRIELTRDDGSVVDIHPVSWDDNGNGTQQGMDGAVFNYPADDITVGTIDGRQVRCISGVLQRTFHTGYDLTDIDRHDLAVLDSL